MDPASLGIALNALAPVLAALIFAALPIGIIHVLKSHKVRMRELDLEERMLPRNTEARLAAIEERLASIEQAVGASTPGLSGRRADLLEGPATGTAESAPPVRARER
jgi:hypothetical protein